MAGFLRIVVISRIPPFRCGVAEYTSMLGEALRSLGVHVIFHGSTEQKGAVGVEFIEAYSGIRARVCFEDPPIYFLEKCLASDAPVDVVHVQYEPKMYKAWKSLIHYLKHAKSMGIRVAVTMHNVARLDWEHPIVPDALEAQRQLTRISDAIIVHSPLQEYELLFQGVPEGKVHRIPHGTLINPYAGVPKSQLVQELRLDDRFLSHTIILVPGFVRADKNWSVLLRAYRELRKKYDVLLSIVGGPQGESDYDVAEGLLREAQDFYFDMGFQPRDKLLKWMALADVVMLPYISTERGYAVSGMLHLAMGSRKPVVCTRSDRLFECNFLTPELTLHTLTAESIASKLADILEGRLDVKASTEKLWRYALETRWSRVGELHVELYKVLAGS